MTITALLADDVVSVVLVGKGDFERLLAVTKRGDVFVGRAGRANPNQWHTSWDKIEWTRQGETVPVSGGPR